MLNLYISVPLFIIALIMIVIGVRTDLKENKGKLWLTILDLFIDGSVGSTLFYGGLLIFIIGIIFLIAS